MTYFVILAFAVILGSLAAALYYMLRGGATQAQKSRNMARALGLRVGVSVLLFLCVLLAWKLGYIHPTGIPPGR
jgi:predicted permease